MSQFARLVLFSVALMESAISIPVVVLAVNSACRPALTMPCTSIPSPGQLPSATTVVIGLTKVSCRLVSWSAQKRQLLLGTWMIRRVRSTSWSLVHRWWCASRSRGHARSSTMWVRMRRPWRRRSNHERTGISGLRCVQMGGRLRQWRVTSSFLARLTHE